MHTDTMDEEYMDESVFIPQWRSTPVRSTDSPTNVQIDPQTAIAQSKGKVNIRRALTNAGLIAVLIVAVAGGMASVREKQAVRVDASVDLKKALWGRIDDVDASGNEFILLYESSEDPMIAQSRVYKWRVSLPPGEDMGTKSVGLRTCLVVSDLESAFTYAHAVPCSDVIKSGKRIVVEYLIVKSESSRMVAKTIIGQK